MGGFARTEPTTYLKNVVVQIVLIKKVCGKRICPYQLQIIFHLVRM